MALLNQQPQTTRPGTEGGVGVKGGGQGSVRKKDKENREKIW